MYYANELKALKRSGRLRTRTLYNKNLLDFASNDYLGLAHNKVLHEATCHELSQLSYNSSKASLLVNGYHPIHQAFEQDLCRVNGFEEGVVLGSGFNANIALIEALVRKGDTLFIDEKYHASGMLAAQIGQMDVVQFKHNSMEELEQLLKTSSAKRKVVAVEGVYSMDGDIVDKEVFELCDRYDALLIMDEAHSSGVIGSNLLGAFDYYDVAIKPNYIKMGTLGKAYGSFGAYILASSHIIEYLINRAKPIIYATSLSLYDTLLAHKSFLYMQQNKKLLKEEIELRQKIVQERLGIDIQALIVPIVIADNHKVMLIKESMEAEGFSIGAIREPTVPKAIVRLIARLGESSEALARLCDKVTSFR